ncbi:ABC transporter ATPase [Caloranaerobacter azorensis H53214]|uniref:ABC transporter ATPase n=1 Tax=Caloranaerobacter azorensis H53214 TaxID=1156417 RepID=A0A096BF06_9FIRM|nr:ABC-ATPase domain-containing protein [Caloranaerobacter azorensis]KGG79765.1 ABC transporter ATPase [Caloranaerobacter azorensis H53214]
MKDKEFLRKRINQLNNKGYKLYKEIQGEYDFDDFILYIDYVQGDPFASPSRMRVRVSIEKAKIPKKYFDNKYKKIALEDFLIRSFHREIKSISKGIRGTGKSGLIHIDVGGQEILERTAAKINENYIEMRFFVGLPARGRKILAQVAIEMLFNEIPKIVENSLIYDNLNKTLMVEYINLIEDQIFLREEMKKRGLVTFIANDSILPRESGISDKPMKGRKVIPFKSPKSLEVEFNLPNRGHIKGMGIKRGVTLIVGGGYHGKSTLLKAIERGVYNHIPGDGREFVLTVEDAVKIRAEDGRKIENVDISPFISKLPFGLTTEDFTTENASGSTSQAANIMEALEIGTSLLLLDEDTSATNFMIRDGRMQSLVSKEKEPITPFIDRVRQLYEKMKISTILVVGGSGDYFDVADCVIMMENYEPKDVTDKAKRISEEYRSLRKIEVNNDFGRIKNRIPIKRSLEIKGKDKIKVKGIDKIMYGKTLIDLSFVEQLVDSSQTEAIANIIKYIRDRYINDKTSLKDIIKRVYKDIEEKSLDIISPYTGSPAGNLAMPRPYEVVAAINRLRIIKMK